MVVNTPANLVGTESLHLAGIPAGTQEFRVVANVEVLLEVGNHAPPRPRPGCRRSY